ncbi:MAG: antitoxin, RHH family protein [Candidatus Omnitrophota bacterium]
MSTKNPRLNVVLEAPLYLAIQRMARKDGVSLSLKARDLIREAIESYEDAYWLKVAQLREKTLHKKSALNHKQIWS